MIEDARPATYSNGLGRAIHITARGCDGLAIDEATHLVHHQWSSVALQDEVQALSHDHRIDTISSQEATRCLRERQQLVQCSCRRGRGEVVRRAVAGVRRIPGGDRDVASQIRRHDCRTQGKGSIVIGGSSVAKRLALGVQRPSVRHSSPVTGARIPRPVAHTG